MEVRVHRGEGKLQHVIEMGTHRVLTDEPVELGGEDTGPAPYDLLAAALAACTAITVTMYARRKSMDLRDIDVRVGHRQQDGVFMLERRISYLGNLSADDKQRLDVIAEKCPVHKTLSGQIRIVTEAR